MHNETANQDLKFETLYRHGAEILRAELINFPVEDLDAMLEFSAGVIRSKPHNSVRIVTVFKEKFPIPANYHKVAEYFKGNRPYVIASAFCGISKTIAGLLNAVITVAGRTNIRGFMTEEEAIEWLVKQK